MKKMTIPAKSFIRCALMFPVVFDSGGKVRASNPFLLVINIVKKAFSIYSHQLDIHLPHLGF